MPFNNSIALAQQFLPVLDNVYKAEAKASILDTANEFIRFIGANVVQVYKLGLQGLGDYDRNTGFVTGDMTGTWETLTLMQDRGRSFGIDTMDNEEVGGLLLGSSMTEFIRRYVAPEIDAYFFAKAATSAGNSDTAAISSGSDAVDAIDAATVAMDDAEVPYEGRILFVSPTIYGYLKAGTTRMVMNRDDNVNYNIAMYNDMRVISVPQARFYSAIDLYDGTTLGEEAGGFVKDAAGKDLNFLIVHPSAVRKIAKHVVPRLIPPQYNNFADQWLMQYRIYHDAFILDNKVDGVYAHISTT